MHWYEHGDANLYERGKPSTSYEYETIICMCPDKARTRRKPSLEVEIPARDFNDFDPW
jgi:hypothetical protein